MRALHAALGTIRTSCWPPSACAGFGGTGTAACRLPTDAEVVLRVGRSRICSGGGGGGGSSSRIRQTGQLHRLRHGTAAAQPGSRQEPGIQPAEPERGQALAPPPPPPAPSPYELLVEGKRFLCTECGKCCQGSGEVWANDAELEAMARALGMSQQHFAARYTKTYSRRPGWRMLKTQANGDCVFLRGGTQCGVYGARPLQCSTYPWWPELMDPVAWIAEGQAVCEGIEHEDALPVDPVQAAQQLRRATDSFSSQAAAAHDAAAAGKAKKGRRPM